MRDKEEWIGTATELLAAMGETETIPTVITKWLNEYRTTFLSENRICYQYSRNAAPFVLETQDCIRHRRIASLLRRVTVLGVTAVTVVTADFWIPPA